MGDGHDLHIKIQLFSQNSCHPHFPIIGLLAGIHHIYSCLPFRPLLLGALAQRFCELFLAEIRLSPLPYETEPLGTNIKATLFPEDNALGQLESSKVRV